jgi:C-terminal processing protease CtpA/Prc
MVEYIISHLLTDSDKSKITDGTYNSIYDHLTNVTTEYKVRKTDFNLDVPVYVLTNKDTFSAAEEFAYDLAQINAHVLKDGRFTVVGQTTKGGAHAMAGCPLMDSTTGAINDEYFLWVPNRTTINPYTHTNWEDGPKMAGELPGVRPNVAIEDGQDALEVALRINSIRERVTPPTATVEAVSKDIPEGLIPDSSATLTNAQVNETFTFLSSQASAGEHSAISTGTVVPSTNVDELDEPPSAPTLGSS